MNGERVCMIATIEAKVKPLKTAALQVKPLSRDVGRNKAAKSQSHKTVNGTAKRPNETKCVVKGTLTLSTLKPDKTAMSAPSIVPISLTSLFGCLEDSPERSANAAIPVAKGNTAAIGG
ncbi:MAG: hypothetical protein ACO2PK_08485 [Armatimonadota bacterium]